MKAVEGLLNASIKVTVTTELATPSANTGPVPEIAELAATGVPPIKTAVPPEITTGDKILIVLVSALLDFNEHVETPIKLETLHAP